MTDDSHLPDQELLARIDITRPHQARVWNYWLGGKDNYPVDRELAAILAVTYPGMEDIARHARAFLGRAVRYLAGEAGIRQFLDIGTGLPTVDNTHEVAQQVDPTSRIVYVDNDPLVLVHARALLASDPRGACDYIEADVRDPDTILEFAAKTLDFTQPTALMLLGVMGTIMDDGEAYALAKQLMGALPPGSHLVFEDGTKTVKPEAAAAAERLRDQGEVYEYQLRTPAKIERFFDGLELLDPGVVSVSRWRVESDVFGLPAEVDAFCGVARKP
ncbi:SAM-dependent methyltransferase [Nonomuraea basaltis]|uniref:SAM-dependent methyltransferase n=1 Tax=Nonomuraea basaltis TaxID=2495887 RepID=UPI00110C493B|nr:SAM-dependent methyltransferase [Nonomuraea basaltis]TMS00646.1 SAM-dependent methyltransferase [Nonomuraea basaltis]